MTEEIKKIIKILNGRVVAFGFKTDKFEKIIDTNKNITSFDIFDEISRKKDKNTSKNKKINIERLRKIYKKKSIDIILFNVDEMKKHQIYLIRETIYIGNDTLYLYGNNEMVEQLLKKYQRYVITYEEIYKKENVILKLNINKAKNNRFKERIYISIDKLINIFNFVVDILTA